MSAQLIAMFVSASAAAAIVSLRYRWFAFVAVGALSLALLRVGSWSPMPPRLHLLVIALPLLGAVASPRVMRLVRSTPA